MGARTKDERSRSPPVVKDEPPKERHKHFKDKGETLGRIRKRDPDEPYDSDPKRRRADGRLQSSIADKLGKKHKVYWNPTGDDRVDIDLTREDYTDHYTKIINSSHKGLNRKPLMTWWCPNPDAIEQAHKIRVM